MKTLINNFSHTFFSPSAQSTSFEWILFHFYVNHFFCSWAFCEELLVICFSKFLAKQSLNWAVSLWDRKINVRWCKFNWLDWLRVFYKLAWWIIHKDFLFYLLCLPRCMDQRQAIEMAKESKSVMIKNSLWKRKWKISL